MQFSGAERVAVVLVHGWTCDASIWEGQREMLEARFCLLIPELPGHGKSPLPARGIEDLSFVNAVDAAMRRAGVSRAVLVGHSMGGVVVRQFARLHPGKVSALVFVETPFDLTETPGDRRWQDAFASHDGLKARRAFIETLFHPSTPAALREPVIRQMLSAPMEVAVQAWQWMTLPNTARPDDRFAGPVFLVDGESNEVAADAVRAMFPRFERVVIEGAGHFVMLEKPAAFNRALLAFLEAILPKL
ncbi:MAG TPA: alpha/beta hydrolase [Opitutaceae bacterium]|nr:alpha/beta hydrolase [Opitutaceae bacterium]